MRGRRTSAAGGELTRDDQSCAAGDESSLRGSSPGDRFRGTVVKTLPVEANFPVDDRLCRGDGYIR